MYRIAVVIKTCSDIIVPPPGYCVSLTKYAWTIKNCSYSSLAGLWNPVLCGCSIVQSRDVIKACTCVLQASVVIDCLIQPILQIRQLQALAIAFTCFSIVRDISNFTQSSMEHATWTVVFSPNWILSFHLIFQLESNQFTFLGSPEVHLHLTRH